MIRLSLRWRSVSAAASAIVLAVVVVGVGVDGWGCDYALIDEDGGLLAEPFHHRDVRTRRIPERGKALAPSFLSEAAGLERLDCHRLESGWCWELLMRRSASIVRLAMIRMLCSTILAAVLTRGTAWDISSW